MEVYLLRHGIAEERGGSIADRSRALTPQGRRKLESVLRRARKAKVSPTLILSSPFRRAFQSAEVAAELLGYHGTITKTAALQPGSSAEAVWREVSKHASEPAILLCGHEPLLGEVFSYLLGADWALVDLRKGALGRIDVEPAAGKPRGRLRWLLTAGVS